MFKNRNEQGSALLLTIIITMILLVLGGALVSFSLMERGQVGRDEADLRAYYIARSGADLVAQLVLENEAEYDDIKGQTTEQVNFDEGYFTAEIEEIPSGVRIVSTGVVGSRKRTVSLVLKGISLTPGFDHAIYANGKINLEGGFRIKGDIATGLSGNPPAFSMTGGTEIDASPGHGHSGDVYISSSIDERYYDNFVNLKGKGIAGEVKAKDIPEYPGINFPDFPTPIPPQEKVDKFESIGPLDFNDSSVKYYRELHMVGQGEDGFFKIDLAKKDCTLVVDNLIFSNMTNVQLENEGHLDIHVKNITFADNNEQFFINYNGSATGDTAKQEAMEEADETILNLFYSGDTPFGGNAPGAGSSWRYAFAGNLITNTADIYSYQDARIKGNILTNAKNVIIGGDGINTGLLYAPYASVEMGNSAESRSVISDSFTAKGGPRKEDEFNVEFEPVDMSILPDDIFREGGGGASSLARSYWER